MKLKAMPVMTLWAMMTACGASPDGPAEVAGSCGADAPHAGEGAQIFEGHAEVGAVGAEGVALKDALDKAALKIGGVSAEMSIEARDQYVNGTVTVTFDRQSRVKTGQVVLRHVDVESMCREPDGRARVRVRVPDEEFTAAERAVRGVVLLAYRCESARPDWCEAAYYDTVKSGAGAGARPVDAAVPGTVTGDDIQRWGEAAGAAYVLVVALSGAYDRPKDYGNGVVEHYAFARYTATMWETRDATQRWTAAKERIKGGAYSQADAVKRALRDAAKLVAEELEVRLGGGAER